MNEQELIKSVEDVAKKLAKSKGIYKRKQLKALHPKEYQVIQVRENMERKKLMNQRLPQPRKKIFEKLDLNSLYNAFKYAYKKYNNVEFNEELNCGEPLKLVYTLLLYFTRDIKFFESPLLHKDEKYELSLSKGLLIVGYYGVGKTSILETISKMTFDALKNKGFWMIKDVKGNSVDLADYHHYFFYSCYSTNDCLSEYIDRNINNKDFRNKYIVGNRYFDDLLTEHFGFENQNAMKYVIEERYLKKNQKSIFSCNYVDGHEGDLNQVMEAIASKYGYRVSSRLNEMVNIIKLVGVDLRK